MRLRCLLGRHVWTVQAEHDRGWVFCGYPLSYVGSRMGFRAVCRHCGRRRAR